MAQHKQCIGILFGGNSPEHDISVLSAKNIIKALDREKYLPYLIGITRSGRWISLQDTEFSLDPKIDTQIVDQANQTQVALIPGDAQGVLRDITNNKILIELDAVIPVLHGPYGEDGAIQGLLRLAQIPFVGPDVLDAAICLDKNIMKHILHNIGIPVAPWITLYKQDYKDFDPQEIADKLGYPCFIKPANTGSSIGIHKVKSPEMLAAALEDAFQYDHKLVIEAFIDGREIECAVLGNSEPKVALPGEIITSHEFYSYEAKYHDATLRIDIPAKLSDDQITEVQQLAKRVFKHLDCHGLARIDFFLQANGKFLLNEVNTLPGFTAVSLYPKAWENCGITQTELLSALIELAFEYFDTRRDLKSDYCI